MNVLLALGDSGGQRHLTIFVLALALFASVVPALVAFPPAMARDAELSDTEEVSEALKSKGKEISKSQKASTNHPTESVEESDGGDASKADGSDGGEEEEYEIEEILDAKKGKFSGVCTPRLKNGTFLDQRPYRLFQGQWGYFVSWKGYPSEENCWIAENDAGYAHSRQNASRIALADPFLKATRRTSSTSSGVSVRRRKRQKKWQRQNLL